MILTSFRRGGGQGFFDMGGQGFLTELTELPELGIRLDKQDGLAGWSKSLCVGCQSHLVRVGPSGAYHSDIGS